MKTSQFSIIFFVLTNPVSAVWLKEDIPDPWENKSFVFDPEKYIDFLKLNETIYNNIYKNVISPCDNVKGYEMRLIIIDSMFKSFWVDKEKLAMEYSVYLHNKFQLGDKDCKNGILAFFSLEDRTSFISLGKGLNNHLPSRCMQQIMEDIMPYMKSFNYNIAFDKMLIKMNRYLDSNEVEDERRVVIIVCVVIGCILLAFCSYCFILPFIVYYVKYMIFKYEYHKVKKKLEKIDNEKEKIRNGNYFTDECPICMEENKEICYTLCGHGICYKCLEEWKKHSRLCPICRHDMNVPRYTDVKKIQLEELRYKIEKLQRDYPRIVTDNVIRDFETGNCSSNLDFYCLYYNNENSYNDYHTFTVDTNSFDYGDFSDSGVGSSW